MSRTLSTMDHLCASEKTDEGVVASAAVSSAIRADPPPISLSASASPLRPAKSLVCTADELHYTPVNGAGWHLALWWYGPPGSIVPTGWIWFLRESDRRV